MAIDLGPAFRGANPVVLGMDGAFSLPLGHGRSLWLFGDTLLGRWRPGGQREISGMPSSTGAVVSDAGWTTGFCGARFLGGAHPSPVFGSASSGTRIWPMDLIATGKRVAVYAVEVGQTGEGPLAFRIREHGVAETSMDRLLSGGPLAVKPLWPADAPGFGASVLRWHGAIYAYAGGPRTYLARLEGEPDDARAYRYWDGGRWLRDWHHAAPLPGSGPELSVRYDPYLAGFLMIYLSPWERTLYARLAPAPWGPWSAARPLLKCGDARALCYGAKQHVELDADGGRTVVLSYNTNGTPQQLGDRPDLYWPHLVRVTFRHR